MTHSRRRVRREGTEQTWKGQDQRDEESPAERRKCGLRSPGLRDNHRARRTVNSSPSQKGINKKAEREEREGSRGDRPVGEKHGEGKQGKSDGRDQ